MFSWQVEIPKSLGECRPVIRSISFGGTDSKLDAMYIQAMAGDSHLCEHIAPAGLLRIELSSAQEVLWSIVVNPDDDLVFAPWYWADDDRDLTQELDYYGLSQRRTHDPIAKTAVIVSTGLSGGCGQEEGYIGENPLYHWVTSDGPLWGIGDVTNGSRRLLLWMGDRLVDEVTLGGGVSTTVLPGAYIRNSKVALEAVYIPGNPVTKMFPDDFRSILFPIDNSSFQLEAALNVLVKDLLYGDLVGGRVVEEYSNDLLACLPQCQASSAILYPEGLLMIRGLMSGEAILADSGEGCELEPSDNATVRLYNGQLDDSGYESKFKLNREGQSFRDLVIFPYATSVAEYLTTNVGTLDPCGEVNYVKKSDREAECSAMSSRLNGLSTCKYNTNGYVCETDPIQEVPVELRTIQHFCVGLGVRDEFTGVLSRSLPEDFKVEGWKYETFSLDHFNRVGSLNDTLILDRDIFQNAHYIRGSGYESWASMGLGRFYEAGEETPPVRTIICGGGSVSGSSSVNIVTSASLAVIIAFFLY